MNQEMLLEIEKFLTQTTGLGSLLLWNTVNSITIIIICWIIQFLLKKFLNKKITNAQANYKWHKIITYMTLIIIAVLIFRVWFRGIQDVVTYLGLISAGLAVVMKDPILNIAGWWFIVIKKWFVVGDRIQIGEHVGDVIDQQFSNFTLLELGNWVQATQSTGRIIHIPNSRVFSETLANYTRDFKYLWEELIIIVTFESNWKKALEILNEIALKHTYDLAQKARQESKKTIQKMIIQHSSPDPHVYVRIEDSGVQFNMRYICEVRNRRQLAETIFIDILEEFDKHDDIDLAYPTQRIYYNPQEGKNKSTNPHPKSS